MSVFDAIGCSHGRWLEAEPDALGEQTCVFCERRVPVVLTRLAYERSMNAVARAEGFPVPFPEMS